MKKSNTIRFRCDDGFLELLHKKMKKSKIGSYSDFVRESIKKVKIIERCHYVDKIRYEINKIGVNINQITHYTNSKKAIDNVVLSELQKTNYYLSQILNWIIK